MRKLATVRHKVIGTLLGSHVRLGCKIGRNLRLPHAIGIVIHEDSVIGDDCMIMQNVTIGITSAGGAPQLGNRVYIGAGAKVLGAVTIGDDARIGANAVVLVDVPAGCTAVGVPAKIVRTPESAIRGR